MSQPKKSSEFQPYLFIIPKTNVADLSLVLAEDVLRDHLFTIPHSLDVTLPDKVIKARYRHHHTLFSAAIQVFGLAVVSTTPCRRSAATLVVV